MRRPQFHQLPFLLQLLWNPVRALDLLDREGSPDHTIIFPTLFTFVYLAIRCLCNVKFEWYEVLILASLTAGISGLYKLLKSGALKGNINTVNTVATSLTTAVNWNHKDEKVNNRTETVAHTITEKIEPRDHAEGMQATAEVDHE